MIWLWLLLAAALIGFTGAWSIAVAEMRRDAETLRFDVRRLFDHVRDLQRRLEAQEFGEEE